MKNNQISQKITSFHERVAPEKGLLVGYGALIDAFNLKVPLPERISLISEKHKRYTTNEWLVFTPRHTPKDTLDRHLTFALKYEGIDLHIMKALFSILPSLQIRTIVIDEPLSQYNRKIWFLYEWLMNKKLPIHDLTRGNYVDLIDSTLQYPGPVANSKRHRIRNNLPGSRNFCPLIRKTPALDEYISLRLSQKIEGSLKHTHQDLLIRTSAFLLLKDSKASFTIEGENPQHTRAQRWARAISQAGKNSLSKEEFLRLQKIIIENDRFTPLGFRKEGGFIGEHDRERGTPIPEHISAKWQDIESLIEGLITMNNKLESSNYDAILMATLIAFGFVFIHPLVDGNGRIHRYLIHHVLARKKFAYRGIIFPISAAILKRIDTYSETLRSYSEPRLDLIQWRPTSHNNVEVLNNTADLYRYFDATKQAEFLYSCVRQTIDEIIPEEIRYLYVYDQMKTFLNERFDMPNKMIALLVRFLNQNDGKLSKRARSKEFKKLHEKEIVLIENKYKDLQRKAIP